MNLWLNRLAPDFTLPTAQGGRVSLSDWRGSVVVVTFWSAGCPWSRRADVLLVYRMLTWQPRSVRVVGVASNANENENEIRYEVERRQVSFPVALDFDHRTADLYKAETTPHFFVLDRQAVVRYVGALDDATTEAPDARRLYLDEAVKALLENRTPDPAYTAPYGCEIVRQAGALSTLPAKH